MPYTIEAPDASAQKYTVEPPAETTAAGMAGSFTRGIAPYAAGAGIGAGAGALLGGVGAIPGAVAGAGAVGLGELASTISKIAHNTIGTPAIPGAQDLTDKAFDAIGTKRPTTNIEGMAETTGAMLGGIPSVAPIGGAARNAVSEIPRKLIEAEPKPVAVQAHEAGYTLPPVFQSEKPTGLSDKLSGWAQDLRTRQGAIKKNQPITNRMAAEELGLPADTSLAGKDAFEDVREKAGKAYEAIKVLPKIEVDEPFRNFVETLGGANSHAAKEFPGLMGNPKILALRRNLSNLANYGRDLGSGKPILGDFSSQAGVELVKKLRRDATGNLLARDKPNSAALGLAQREAADAIDDLFERNLVKAGHTDLVDQYRAARQLIAKSHDIEKATNSATGNVSATALARLQDKGRPLSGKLKTIADIAKAFPHVMRAEDSVAPTSSHSGLDFLGSWWALLKGHPGMAATMMARPVARAAILSKGYQNLMFPKVPSP